MPARVPPLAVGLLHVPFATSAAERRQRRIGLALAAARAGYALVETFEFGMGEDWDDLQFQAVEELALQLDVQALVVSDAVDIDRAEDIGERLRLIVVVLAQAGA